ncbi:MAG TPA: hypothetical protein VMV14_10895 [Acidimicrobiales bacterium]|nr:hypothetical protein [Acidimicrobiales bacterium]
MQDGDLDPRELLERLHADRRLPAWDPPAPSPALAGWRQRPMRDEEPLEYLHGHWALPEQFDPATAGGGWRGRLVGLFGRLAFRVLGPYLHSERELLARVVRMNDALARRCDELADVIAERQMTEAESGASLAAWLHVLADSQADATER